MASEKIVEILATKVMGWKLPDDPTMIRSWMKWQEQSKRWVWAGFWSVEPQRDYIDKNNPYEEPDYHTADLLTGQQVFDPLHNFNHMAIVRAKMRDRGYWRKSWDRREPIKTQVTYYMEWGRAIGEHSHKDELLAEALAIKSAIESEEST